MRTLIAAAVAPLPIVALALAINFFGPPEAFSWTRFEFTAVLSAIAYIDMLLLGLPTYLVSRKFGFATPLMAAAVGYVAAYVAAYLFASVAVGFLHATENLLSFWLSSPVSAALQSIPIGALGIGVGMFFWQLANPRRLAI